MSRLRVVVIGAGIAGVSAAAELAASHSVTLVEQEEHPAYHATGRSAALFSEIYGNAVIRALSRASRSFLFEPPSQFADAPLVQPRGSLFVARSDQCAAIDKALAGFGAGVAVERVAADEALRIAPLLDPSYIAEAIYEPGSVDVDLHALLQGYLRQLRAHAGRLLCASPVTALRRIDGEWIISAGAETIRADVIVNAAGAWADEIARLAGLAQLGLVPCRRTALLVDPPEDLEISQLPLIIDIDEQFYVKPDAGNLLLSPADETPSVPCDAAPEELDVAIAVDRVCTATTLKVTRVKHRWAGLRSFFPDRSPAVGFDHRTDGFFWLAGQGGYGVQTAPALSRFTAATITGEALPAELADAGVDAGSLSPARLLA